MQYIYNIHTTERKKSLRKTAPKMDGHGEQRLNKNRFYYTISLASDKNQWRGFVEVAKDPNDLF